MAWTEDEEQHIKATLAALSYVAITNTIVVARLQELVTKTKSRLPESLVTDAENQPPSEVSLDSKNVTDLIKRRNTEIKKMMAIVRNQLR